MAGMIDMAFVSFMFAVFLMLGVFSVGLLLGRSMSGMLVM